MNRKKIIPAIILALFLCGLLASEQLTAIGNGNSVADIPIVSSVDTTGSLPPSMNPDGSDADVQYAGKNAPDFSWMGRDRKTHSLKDYRGKVVILNFWATWCPPCKRELPDLVSVYQQNKANGVEVIGISLDRQEQMRKGVKVASFLSSFMKKNKMTYPVIFGDMWLAKAYGGVNGIPTTFIIDKNGVIREYILGEASGQQFRDGIAKAQ